MDAAITGATAITLRDQIDWVFLGGRTLVRWIFIGAGLGILLAGVEFLIGAGDPRAGLLTLAVLTIGFPVFVSIATIAIQAVFFHRLSTEQREMTWQLDAEKLTLYDASGNTIVTPWSQVRRVIELKRGFSLLLRPSGSRYLPKRAFSDNDIDQARRLLRRPSMH